MNDFIYIGKIVGTHGIKGEIRILSDFEQKKQIFISDFPIYIGKSKQKEIINTYRFHKIYDMVTLKGYNNINEVLDFKQEPVYVKREDLKIEGYLLDDLINFDIYQGDEHFGNVAEIIKNKSNILLKIEGKKNFYIPKCDEFIINVDIEKKKIIVKNIGGLL